MAHLVVLTEEKNYVLSGREVLNFKSPTFDDEMYSLFNLKAVRQHEGTNLE